MSAPQGFGAAVRAMLAPRRMAAQAVGFAVGIALVAWVVKGAIDAANDPSRAGILESVRAAWESRPWLVAGIAITTVLSLAIDGALFWLILLPVRRLGFMEIQWLTFVTATSNFFPVRLGIPVRYAYAMLANRMGFLEATWALLVLVALAAGGWILQRAAGLGPVRARMGEWTPMLTTPRTYWAGTLLRVAEVLLWVVRMWCAAEILGLGLSFATVTVLGVASIAVMLNPVGRIGFREATTVVVANWMAGGGLDVAHADAGFKQLALLESLGEMATTIPMGIVAAPFLARWYRRRRREAAAQPSATMS
jgi:hypothetical protein